MTEKKTIRTSKRSFRPTMCKRYDQLRENVEQKKQTNFLFKVMINSTRAHAGLFRMRPEQALALLLIKVKR